MALQIEFKKPGIDQLKKMLTRFQRFKLLFKDLRPIYKEFLDWYKVNIIPEAFDSKGKLMGKKWAALSPAYAKKVGRSQATLRLTETLYNAAKGGSGWFEKIGKKDFTFGIEDSIPYNAIHQYGKPPKGCLKDPICIQQKKICQKKPGKCYY